VALLRELLHAKDEALQAEKAAAEKVVHAKDEALQAQKEVVHAKDEALQAEKAAAEKVVHAKDEALQAQKELVHAKDEALQAQKEAAAAELRAMRADLRAAADEAARAVEGVKLRGIVEYLAKTHGRAGGAQHGLDALFRDDSLLQRLVTTFGTSFKLLRADLDRCASGLYHTLSKELHGSEARPEVREAHWRSPAERAVLCALLERFAVTYAYVDPAGVTVQSPYATLAKRVLEGEGELPQEQEHEARATGN
jgi:hypothetical protein